MQLSSYVEELRASLMAAAVAGGEESRAVAERLVGALDSSARLVLLEALSAAAAEITRDLAPTSIDVRLRGLDPEFVVSAPPVRQPEPPVGFGADLAEAEESATTRTTLRLPEPLKLRVEDAAAREGMSVNAWLVRAVTTAVTAKDGGGTGRSAPASGQKYRGWAH